MIFIFNECNYRKLDQCYELAHLWSSVGGFHLYLDCLREMRFSYHAPQLQCSCQTWDGIVDCFELWCLWLSHWNFHKILVPEKRKHANHVMNCILVNCNRNLHSFHVFLTVGLMLGIFPLSSLLIYNTIRKRGTIRLRSIQQKLIAVEVTNKLKVITGIGGCCCAVLFSGTMNSDSLSIGSSNG